jgi:hypothetical protein
MVVETIDSYHRLAQTIWPMTQPPQNHTSTKLHPPITKSDTRQLKRISRLRNAAKNMLPKPNANTPTATDTTRTIKTRTHATEVLQLADPPPLEDIPALCHRAITTIINKANRKLTNSLRKKEDQLYKKVPNATITTLKRRPDCNQTQKTNPSLRP